MSSQLAEDFERRLHAARGWACEPNKKGATGPMTYESLAAELDVSRRQLETWLKESQHLLVLHLSDIASALGTTEAFLRGDTNELSPALPARSPEINDDRRQQSRRRQASRRTGDIDLAREALQQIEAARQTIQRLQG